MTKNYFRRCTLVVCLLLSVTHFAEGAAGKLYIVSADIVAVTESPGLSYEREENTIPYSEGLNTALVYGNMLMAAPLTQGKYAGVWVEVKEGEDFGFVDLAALAPLPSIDYFPKPEPCRFAIDSPPLYLLPGSLSILEYTHPDHKPYYVLAGEVVDGVGTYKDASGLNWTLLQFNTSDFDYGYRYAWTRSENVTRLSLYEPDHARINPALVPYNVRDFGIVDKKFRTSMLKNGFAIDAAPIIHEKVFMDDLMQSYPNSYFMPVYTPNFVTTDVFLHAFHKIFSHGLMRIEERNFAPALENMLKLAITKLNELEKKSGKDAKNTFALARDFLTVPLTLCSPTQKLSALTGRVKKEIGLVLRAEGIRTSAITGKKDDYTLYKPRGHYFSSEPLSRYFRAMAYLGGMSIPLRSENQKKDNVNTALTALLCILFEDAELRKLWDSLYEPLSCLIGTADDPSIIDYWPIVKKLLNDKTDKLTDTKTLEALQEALIAASPTPRLVDFPISQDERGMKAAGLRLLGRRFVLDEWVFAQLTSPRVGSEKYPRDLPKVADVMAALGSSVADDLLEEDRRNIPKFSAAIDRVKQDVYSFLAQWDGSMTSAWLGSLGIYLTDRDSKQYFWNSPQWELKKLLTASASWTELKNDITLMSKRNYSEKGAGGEWKVEPFGNPMPQGYVEPSPRTFEALANSLSRLHEILMKYDLGENDGNALNGARAMILTFLERVRTFANIAEKEVKEEPLSNDDLKAISQITSYLNADLPIDIRLADDDAEKEDNYLLKMALVNEIATDAREGRALYAATGTPLRLYVFVNDKWGGPRVTIGYTYSYYEFARYLSDGRMIDEEWRKLVYSKSRRDELEELTPRWSKDLFVR